MQIIVRPAAAADIDDAFLWYEGQRVGLGHEFLAAAQTSIDAIAEHPLRFQTIRRNTRRVLLRRFPYAVYFAVEGDFVVALAVVHASRNPDQWQGRGG